MTEAFEYIVQDNEKIKDLVEEIHLRAQDEITHLFLDHQEEPNIVRGRGEPLIYQDNEEMPEIRRKDGGLTWYHENTSCYMIGVPNQNSKNTKEVMRAWGNRIVQELEEIGYNPELEHPEEGGSGYRGPDIYDQDTGEQMIGLSATLTKDSTVARACWYEEDIESKNNREFEKLLEEDNIDSEEFYDNLKPVKGLYKQLNDSINPETVADEFISDEAIEATKEYKDREEGYIRGTCILD